jgi:PAS domain S-box-containing protein
MPDPNLPQDPGQVTYWAHLAAIVESSDDAIMSMDLSGTILTWNRAAEHMYGYTETEIVGQSITRLIPPERLNEETEILQKIRQGERVKHYETVRQCKDGKRILVSLTVSPIRDTTGQIVGASKTARDITEHKRIEEELRALTHELDVRVAERTQELTASQERLRGLARELSLAEEQVRRQIATELHDYLGQLLVVCRLKIKNTLARATDAHVGQDLQDADRILQDSIAYTRSLVAQLTPPVLREFGLVMGLTWLANQMGSQGLSVTLKIMTTHVPIEEEHAILVFQCIRELLMNVVKHAGTPEAVLTIGLGEDDVLTITIADKGRGFDVVAEQAAGAAHFGLFSIRERIEAIGGSLTVESVAGEGTSATLRVPVQRTIAVSPSSASSPGTSVATNKPVQTDPVRILMVDDHPLVRQGMRSIIDGLEGMQVVGEAADGREAVQAAGELRPHVVIMDVNMPHMDGIEATRLIKRAHPETVIVGLSVHNSEQVSAAMSQAGASAYLTKEAAPEQLHQAITNSLRSRSRP